MLSTVGLELTNFINPNLSWKKVTKGFRSTVRRSRKQAARSLNMVAKLGDKSPRRDGDSSVSESEKLGVAVLGRRFTEKPEHVPIKKRRLMLRSPSPSPQAPNHDHDESVSFNEQTASPRLEVSKHHLDCKYASGNLELFSNWQIGTFDGSTAVNSSSSVTDRVKRGKITEEPNGKLYFTDDFSGIELLAAAACSDSIGDDAENSRDAPIVEESSTREGLNSSIANVPLKDVEHEHNADASFDQEDFLVGSQKHDNEYVGTAKKCIASKDDRLHWDLNTVMDTWEDPCNDSIVEFQRNVSEDVLENAIQREKLEILEVENLTVSSASIRDVQPATTCDAKRQDNEASVDDAVDVDCVVHIRPEELVPKHLELPTSTGGAEGESVLQESHKCYADDTCISKVSSPFDDCRNSNVSHEDHGHLVGVENMIELQEGYDSPFEDGELRESVIYSWEENDTEDLETECVDYEPNYVDDSDAADYPASSEKVDAGCEDSQIIGKESLLVEDIVEAGFSKSSSVKSMDVQMKGDFTGNDDGGKVEKVGKKGLNKGSSLDARQSSDLSGDDDSARKSRTSDRDVGSRASRGKLLSRIEGPSSFYILDGKGSVLVQRSRHPNFDGSYPRQRSFACDKSMGRDRLYLRGRHRNEGADHLIDSSMGYWGSRDRYAANYRGPEEYTGHTRPRSFNADYVAKTSRLNGHDDRHLNYSSKGICRPSVRRRSPVERDDSYGLRRGMPSVRGVSFDRSRGRSGICHQRVSRGPRGEYHEAVLDDVPLSSLSMQHYLARRERSPSSSFSRGAYISRPRRKSRSRSKTRSPPAWNLRRESFIRRHSRSPDFRSEARMDRMRLPFQKRCFAADYEENLMSPPRGRFSLEHNSRWINDRNCDDEHFRDRRSPVRMVRQRQRFDSANYAAGRSKPDDNRRTILHSRRFPLTVGPDRVHKYEDGDTDRMKYDKRYEPRVRRNEVDGVTKQSQYDAEDYFEACKSHNDDECIRGTERRDMPSGAREERGPFRYNNDRMRANAPSSGLRDLDGDASPARA